MPSPIELVHYQLELECIGVDANQRLYRLECADPDDLPRYYVAKTSAGYAAYIGQGLDESIAAQLQTIAPEKALRDFGAVRRILYPNRGDRYVIWKGSTYQFITPPAPESYPEVVEKNGAFVVIREGVTVASAWSERLSEHAAEIAIEVSPQMRFRSLGKQVALAWGAHQIAQQRVGFFSHHVENKGSAALARSLGMVHVMDVVSYA